MDKLFLKKKLRIWDAPPFIDHIRKTVFGPFPKPDGTSVKQLYSMCYRFHLISLFQGLLFTAFLIGVLKRISIVFLEDNADSLEDSSSLDWGSVMFGLSLTFGLRPSENLKPSGFLAFEKR